MKKTAQEPKVTENPLYHDTWMLLRKYRDVVWSLELSVQQVRRQFQIEYGSSIEEFLESLYVAGITFDGSAIEDHARCIERSYKMLKLLDTSVELLRTKHKYGESYYWLLYYTYLSPQQLANTQEIIDKLEPHIRDISYRTYFRKRQMAIDALSSVLWGYSSKEPAFEHRKQAHSHRHIWKTDGIKAPKPHVGREVKIVIKRLRSALASLRPCV